MGIKYSRTYEQIITEMVQAISQIPDLYRFIEMPRESWFSLPADEKQRYLRTMADDIFYALGETPRLRVGQGYVRYDRVKDLIRVSGSRNISCLIRLSDPLI